MRHDPIDLCEIAEAARARSLLVYPHERLELEVATDLPSIERDAGLLRRVIDNLVDNARKYSDPASPVTLRLARDGDGVSLQVIDRGMGIDSADLPHIFTPFFRTDRSRTRKTGGVGLGLTLVRRIVTAHGGKVEVESQVGQGTKVSVTLPSGHLEPSAPSDRAHFRTRETDSPHTLAP